MGGPHGESGREREPLRHRREISVGRFGLRNHGLKSLVPGVFPLDAFPTDYALKDMRLALELAAQGGVTLRAAPKANSPLGSTSSRTMLETGELARLMKEDAVATLRATGAQVLLFTVIVLLVVVKPF